MEPVRPACTTLTETVNFEDLTRDAAPEKQIVAGPCGAKLLAPKMPLMYLVVIRIPPLLRLQLQSLGLWDPPKYCLLNLFCENFQANSGK